MLEMPSEFLDLFYTTIYRAALVMITEW